MGSCVSTPPQPSTSSSLFPGVYPTKSTEPSVYVLRPPTRPSTSKQVHNPTSPSRPETETWRRRCSVEVRAIDAARDAGSKATVDLAESQFKATATCAAEASAAAAAISLQIAMLSVDSPKMFSHDDFYTNEKEQERPEQVPSTFVNTETVAPVLPKQSTIAPPVPPTFIQIPDEKVQKGHANRNHDDDDDDVDTLYAVASNVTNNDGSSSVTELCLDSNVESPTCPPLDCVPDIDSRLASPMSNRSRSEY